jgi:Sensors of blue-light using FAD
MALLHLIYQSRVNVPLNDETILKLLESSRVFNAKHDISGILLYGYGTFLQMLEGDDDLLRALYYDKISNDPRHHSLKVLKEDYVKKRLFGQWAMAFRPLNQTLIKGIPGYVDPDTPSAYGRSLLAPLRTIELMEYLALEVKRRGE